MQPTLNIHQNTASDGISCCTCIISTSVLQQKQELPFMLMLLISGSVATFTKQPCWISPGQLLGSLSNEESATLAVFRIYLELLHPSMRTGNWNILTERNKRKGEKQILIGQRVLESGKWKLYSGHCHASLIHKKRLTYKHLGRVI